MSEEFTSLRVGKSLNQRLKDTLRASGNGMSVTKLAEALLGECVDAIQSPAPSVPPTVQLLHHQRLAKPSGGRGGTVSYHEAAPRPATVISETEVNSVRQELSELRRLFEEFMAEKDEVQKGGKRRRA